MHGIAFESKNQLLIIAHYFGGKSDESVKWLPYPRGYRVQTTKLSVLQFFYRVHGVGNVKKKYTIKLKRMLHSWRQLIGIKVVLRHQLSCVTFLCHTVATAVQAYCIDCGTVFFFSSLVINNFQLVFRIYASQFKSQFDNETLRYRLLRRSSSQKQQ